MIAVDLVEARENLSRLVVLVETGAEAAIVIMREGKPAARLLPVAPPINPDRRLGLLERRFASASQEEFHSDNFRVRSRFPVQGKGQLCL